MRRALMVSMCLIASVAVMIGGPAAGVMKSPTDRPFLYEPIYADTSPPLRDLAKLVTPPNVANLPGGVGIPKFDPLAPPIVEDNTPDAALQSPDTPNPPATSTSPASPVASFEGISEDEVTSCGGFDLTSFAPPDPSGEAGLTQYLQMINVCFAVFSKTGTVLLPPTANNVFWLGMEPGGEVEPPSPVCSTSNVGDPIVEWDHLANRWLVSQFANSSPTGLGLTPPFYECIAISETFDALGPWHRYAYLVHPVKFNDYPKFGVWPDAYYMSANQFLITAAGLGAGLAPGAWAFEREKMLDGDPTALLMYFDLGPANPAARNSLLPADLNGKAPLAGTPNFFVRVDDPANQLEMWDFHVDWAMPLNSTFGVGSTPGLGGTPNRTLPVTAFASVCPGTRNCVPQADMGIDDAVDPADDDKLDGLSPRLLQPLPYRRVGAYEYILANHTVNVTVPTTRAGVRWYILRRRLPRASLPGGTWEVWQQSTYAPDAEYRWMGSIGMDKFGNVAVGYSASSASIHPEIRYNGRAFGDVLDTLGPAEQLLWAGEGSQLDTSNRWGDYTHMALDPTDDCTFWYQNEYYGNAALDVIPALPPIFPEEPDDQPTESFDWRTRIGSFRFPNCPAPAT